MSSERWLLWIAIFIVAMGVGAILIVILMYALRQWLDVDMEDEDE